MEILPIALLHVDAHPDLIIAASLVGEVFVDDYSWSISRSHFDFKLEMVCSFSNSKKKLRRKKEKEKGHLSREQRS